MTAFSPKTLVTALWISMWAGLAFRDRVRALIAALVVTLCVLFLPTGIWLAIWVLFAIRARLDMSIPATVIALIPTVPIVLFMAAETIGLDHAFVTPMRFIFFSAFSPSMPTAWSEGLSFAIALVAHFGIQVALGVYWRQRWLDITERALSRIS